MTLLGGPRSERLVALSFVGLAVTSAAWLLSLVEHAEQRRAQRIRQLSHFCALRAVVGAARVGIPGPIRELDGLFDAHRVEWVRGDCGLVLDLRPEPTPEARE